MQIAAAYVRVSDERQDEYSPDSQLKLIRAFAEKNSMVLPQEYIFYDDGISAKSAKKRTQFNNMIALAKDKQHPFDVILVWKFSRFARNQEESIVYKSLLKKVNVQVISVSEPISDDPFGSLIERIIEWMDEYYLTRLSGEVKRGMLEKASRGEPVSAPPFGYDLVNKQLVPNKDAETVRRVFAQYAAGVPVVAIARSAGASGVRTRRGNPPDNRWVDYMLNNPVYIGKIRWSKEGKQASRRNYHGDNVLIVDGSHEPIISADLWQAAQDRIKETKIRYGKYQRPDQSVDWMLKGLCRCDTCGATLVRLSTRCPSMQCHNYARAACPVSHSLSLAKANAAVIHDMQMACKTMNFNIAPTDTPSEDGVEHNKIIADIERRLAKCRDAYLAGVDTLEEYAKQKRELTRELEKAKKEAAEAASPSPVDPYELRDRVLAALAVVTSDKASEKSKNDALRSVIDRVIYVKSSGELAVYYR